MTDRGNQWQRLRRAALTYANAGWPVFPLRPGSKRPATPNHTAENCDGSDPRCTAGHVGWEGRATTDLGRIERAWDRRPYGIGIACGRAKLIVIDLDVPKAGGITGAEALRTLEHEHGERLPGTFSVATPSGGRHLYYQTPRGKIYSNTASRVGPRIDTRSTGGYVVAPPTETADGSYEIIDDQHPVELPMWFSALLETPARSAPRADGNTCTIDLRSPRVDRYVSAAVDGELRRVVSACEGRRNDALFVASVAIGQLVGAELMSRAEAETTLELAANGHLAAGAYSQSQARKTIASGLTRGQREPRQLPGNFAEAGNR